MSHKNTVACRRQVFKDCAKAMAIPTFAYGVSDLFSKTVLVAIANYLGVFADSVFQLDFSLSLRNVLILILCVFLSTLIAPMLTLLSDFSMLGRSLNHDRTVFGHFFCKTVNSVKSSDMGELQYELEDAPIELRNQWICVLSKSFSLPITLCALTLIAGKISWALTVAVFLLTSVRLAVPILFSKRLAECDASKKSYLSKRRGLEMDIAQYPHLFSIWGIQKSVLARYEAMFEDYYDVKGSKYEKYQITFNNCETLVKHLTTIILLVIGASSVAAGSLTPGGLTTMLAIQSVLEGLFEDFGLVLKNYPLLLNAARRVGMIYGNSEQQEGERVSSFSNLTIKNLEYRYSGRPVLSGVSFDFSLGEKVEIAGPNGSGKSTLCKIVSGLSLNYTGEVFVNGVSLSQIDIDSWRDCVAYCPQSAYILNATVRENIAICNPSLPNEALDMFLAAFGLADLADRNVSNDSNLSGGERQKISIIRAIIKKGDLLILDEPTNHLDRQSMEWLRNYLEGTGRAVLLVSHDESMKKVANRIVQCTDAISEIVE